jgi:chorismate dehydratase
MQFNVGRIDFINTAPVYAGADCGRVELPGRTVRGSPAELNALLRAGKLQLSSISSIEYAHAYPDLLVLPGISISCLGPVRSVLLYSRVPLHDLAGTVGLTNRSATARALVRIIVEEFFKRSVAYLDVDIGAEVSRRSRRSDSRRRGTAFPGGLDALLVIGDDALSLNLHEAFPHVLDLGEFWVDRTGMPFVFGLWAVKRDFALEHPLLVEEYKSGLLKSLGFGLKEPDRAVEIAAGRSNVPAETIRSYLDQIDYFLGPEHLAGLRHFFEILERRREIEPGVELRFFDRPREHAGHA